jgi:tetratricopeptide (TPR) repeat protein
MTSETRAPALHRSSARDFLYCQPDPRPARRAAVFPDPQFCGRLDGVDAARVGSAFVTCATALIEPLARFATVVLRLDADPPPPETGASRVTAQHRLLAACLGDLQKDREGWWGWLDWDIFGWILPEADAAQGLERVREFQACLEGRTEATVSAGVAVYPCLNFSKSQMLENARKALDHAAFFGPGQSALFDDVTLNISGDQRYQHGDINGAMAEFKKALDLNPDNLNAHNSLGVCYGVVGAYETALRCFEAVLKRAPGDLMALYNAGLVNRILGDRERALGFLLAAAETGEPVFEVAFHTGRLYMEQHQAAQARPFLESATRLCPEAGPAWRLLGECLFALEAVGEAVAAYKRAIKLNPGDAESLSALGCLFDRQGENPEITTIFCEQAVDIAPENGLFHHRLGALYVKQQRYDEALRALRRAAELGCDTEAEINAVTRLGILPPAKGKD